MTTNKSKPWKAFILLNLICMGQVISASILIAGGHVFEQTNETRLPFANDTM
jgi:hypothetical protein